jgi:hypothetical protein
MQQFCKYGSVRGAAGNRRPYRDPYLFYLFQLEFGAHDRIVESVRDQTASLSRQGLEPQTSTPEQFGAFIHGGDREEPQSSTSALVPRASQRIGLIYQPHDSVAVVCVC